MLLLLLLLLLLSTSSSFNVHGVGFRLTMLRRRAVLGVAVIVMLSDKEPEGSFEGASTYCILSGLADATSLITHSQGLRTV